VWWEWLIVLGAVGVAGAWSARLVYRRIRQGPRAKCATCHMRGPACLSELVQIQPQTQKEASHARGDRDEAEG